MNTPTYEPFSHGAKVAGCRMGGEAGATTPPHPPRRGTFSPGEKA